MCRVVSTTGRHNGLHMAVVASHYSEDRLPARYQRRKKQSKPAVSLPVPPVNLYKRVGEANGRTKLSDADVYDIRAAGDAGNETLATLAKRYGISDSYVSAIINRTKRAELPERTTAQGCSSR